MSREPLEFLSRDVEANRHHGLNFSALVVAGFHLGLESDGNRRAARKLALGDFDFQAQLGFEGSIGIERRAVRFFKAVFHKIEQHIVPIFAAQIRFAADS